MTNSDFTTFPVAQGGGVTSAHNVQVLHAAISDMHCLSEQGFRQIRGIAVSALSHMQTPDGYLHPEDIAQALDAIWQIADNIRDCISTHAQDAGHAYTDTNYENRLNARRQALGGAA